MQVVPKRCEALVAFPCDGFGAAGHDLGDQQGQADQHHKREAGQKQCGLDRQAEFRHQDRPDDGQQHGCGDKKGDCAERPGKARGEEQAEQADAKKISHVKPVHLLQRQSMRENGCAFQRPLCPGGRWATLGCRLRG